MDKISGLTNKAKIIFIGVAWPYVNGDLHPGHIAGNFLPADIFARFHRYLGNKVLMVSGADCFGTPITVEADKRKLSPEEIVAEYHPLHLKLFDLYGISFDLYTQTKTKNHQKISQELIIALAKNGYIFKDKTKQFFSPEENKFLPDRYVEGECKYCGFKEARGDQCEQCGRVLDYSEIKNPVNKLTKKSLILKETEHLFLDWSKLQKVFLEKYVKSLQNEWKEWIYKETWGWLENGLKPRALTRDINWGVEIPNEQLPQELQLNDVKNKRLYVWNEAIIGYLSATIEWSEKTNQDWKQYWYPKNNQDVKMYNFMGKDNVVFHALFWPGQLYGAYGGEVKKPDIIAANQYLNLEGKKFSKSRGVTIDSVYLAKTYRVDPVRFYLTYIMPENSDADFSWQGLVDFNNNVLIGTLGNFINRVIKLAEPLKFKEPVLDKEVINNIEMLVAKARQHLSKTEFKQYSQTVIELASYGNKYIDAKSPWHLEKKSKEYNQAVTNSLLIVLALCLILKPLIPNSQEKLEKILGIRFKLWPENNIIGLLQEQLQTVSIANPHALFQKIDPGIVEKERSKINH